MTTNLEKYPYTGIVSPFPVLPISSTTKLLSAECGYDQPFQDMLVNAGFRKVVCVWGTVVAGSPRMPDANMQYAANVFAQFLDPDATGKPKNELIREKLGWKSGKFLGGGVTQTDEKDKCEGLPSKYGCYSFQTWLLNDMRGKDIPISGWEAFSKRVVNEEAFHMYTHALAKVFPDKVGD